MNWCRERNPAKMAAVLRKCSTLNCFDTWLSDRKGIQPVKARATYPQRLSLSTSGTRELGTSQPRIIWKMAVKTEVVLVVTTGEQVQVLQHRTHVIKNQKGYTFNVMVKLLLQYVIYIWYDKTWYDITLKTVCVFLYFFRITVICHHEVYTKWMNHSGR